MTDRDYDIVLVGGGLAGASLGRAMAAEGARVLILERTREFKDRVRGEALTPWGVVEAQKLGIYDLLMDRCGHRLPWIDIYLGSDRIVHRDMPSTTPQSTSVFTFPHPNAQETLLEAAAVAGAEVRRGATVTQVLPGDPPAVEVSKDGTSAIFRARLIVGSDGRSSLARRTEGFEVERDPRRLVICGVLFDSIGVPQDTAILRFNLEAGQLWLTFPQRMGQVRSYIAYQSDAGYRLSGQRDVARFIRESVRTGAPADAFTSSKAIGPLASFEGADSWVPHPFQNGVALLGDAAASSDPSWGEGMSLTFRDARILRDYLLAEDDWNRAGHAYADEHDRHYGVVHTVDNWLAALLLDPGPAGQKHRARALPLLAEDPSRLPDLFALGPDTPVDEAARRRCFGEE